MALTTHIRWGDNDPARQGELERLADWIEAKRLEKTPEYKDLTVMGGFQCSIAQKPHVQSDYSAWIEDTVGTVGLESR